MSDDEPTKRCLKCRELKPVTEFHRRRSSADGLQQYCKPCNIERNKQWYRDNPDARPRRMDGYAKQRRLERQALIFEYLLEHPCVDCGETDPVVLEFDHLRDKVDNVSAMLRLRWSRILAEIEKCEVVCANCHRRREAKRRGYYRARRLESDEP